MGSKLKACRNNPSASALHTRVGRVLMIWGSLAEDRNRSGACEQLLSQRFESDIEMVATGGGGRREKPERQTQLNPFLRPSWFHGFRINPDCIWGRVNTDEFGSRKAAKQPFARRGGVLKSLARKRCSAHSRLPIADAPGFGRTL